MSNENAAPQGNPGDIINWPMLKIVYRTDPDKIAARTKDYEARFANPFVAAEKGFIDEVITPHSTRKRVARAFAALRSKQVQNPWKKHDNIPL